MMSSRYTIFCDGGSRNNPGPAGAGFVISQDDEEVLAAGVYLGETTNNIAEYCGLIWALENVRVLGATHLEVYADSELMVNQINGVYKVKSATLKRFHAIAQKLVESFQLCQVAYVPRAENVRADEMVNAALDACDRVGKFKIYPTTILDHVSDTRATLFDSGMVMEDEKESRVNSAENELSADGSPLTLKGTETIDGVAKSKGIYALTVKGHFDAAHHLYDYPGQCRELHGHTWDVEVAVESEILNDIGIVYDFKDLKDDLSEVLDTYDHKNINEIPPFDVLSPTAENLARVIYEALQTRIADARIAEVAVWESPIARVAYRKRW